MDQQAQLSALSEQLGGLDSTIELLKKCVGKNIITQTQWEKFLEDHSYWLRKSPQDYGVERPSLGDKPDLTGICIQKNRRINLSTADLRGAIFTNQDLRLVSFWSASLQDADFTGADLSGIDMRRASLHNARFVGATMHNCLLDYAKCEGADFTQADITEASTLMTDFDNAIWSDSIRSTKTATERENSIKFLSTILDEQTGEANRYAYNLRRTADDFIIDLAHSIKRHCQSLQTGIPIIANK